MMVICRLICYHSSAGLLFAASLATAAPAVPHAHHVMHSATSAGHSGVCLPTAEML